MVGVESSGYRMGTRVSLNAIVCVPTIVGHYFSPILQTSDKLTSWTMVPPPACRSFPKNKPPRSPPPSAVFKMAGDQITMTTAAADMLVATATTTTATAMMATATTATRQRKKRRQRTATATTSTMVMGGSGAGGDDHNDDNSNGSGGGLIQQSTKTGSGRAATAMATETATAMVTVMADDIRRWRR